MRCIALSKRQQEEFNMKDATLRRDSLRRMTLLALFAAIIVVMANVPFLGYIPLGFMNATTVHIPVIIGACLLGPKAGGALGAVFGLTSLINNTIRPNITSFVFTPFYSLDPRFSGSFKSLLICFVPRILIGVLSALLFRALSKTKLKSGISLAVTGFVGSMVNTVFVMSGIYFLYGESYAAAKDMGFSALLGVIMGVIGMQGVPEAIVAAILTAAITVPVMKYLKR